MAKLPSRGSGKYVRLALIIAAVNAMLFFPAWIIAVMQWDRGSTGQLMVRFVTFPFDVVSPFEPFFWPALIAASSLKAAVLAPAIMLLLRGARTGRWTR